MVTVQETVRPNASTVFLFFGTAPIVDFTSVIFKFAISYSSLTYYFFYRRLPKRGFKCINSKTIVGINVSALEVFDNDAVVSVETLLEKGIVKNPRDGVKILGNGELTKKLTVQANAFSASAKEKIEALGGKAEVI